MKRHLRWLAVGTLVAVALGISPQALAQALTIAPQPLDLGNHLIGSDKPLKGTLTITNRSAEALRLRQVDVSCGCLRVVESFDVIDTGASRTIVVEARPENGPERESIKMLRLRFEGKQIHQEATKVHWREVHPIAAAPHKLDFTAMKAGERRTATVKLLIADPEKNEQLNIKSVHATYPFVETNVVEDGQIQVHVCLPEVFEPARNAELVIDVESSHRSFPTLRLPLVVARIPMPILAVPSTIVLFDRPPLEGKKVQVRLFDRDGEPLHVLSARIERGAEASAPDTATNVESVVELLPATATSDRSKATMEVMIRPSEGGSRQRLVIQFKDSSADRVEIPIHHAYEM